MNVAAIVPPGAGQVTIGRIDTRRTRAPDPAVATLPSSPATERVWFAQAIRGVACLLVVWNHLAQLFPAAPKVVSTLTLLPADRAPFSTPWTAITNWSVRHHINAGSLGVSLFFLTSGFVIPFSLNRGGLRGFFVRRFFRLYPTYWLVMGTSFLLLLWVSGRTHLGFPYDAPTIIFNGVLLHPYAGRPTTDGVNWTLAVEELFYVCAALIAWRHALSRGRVLVALGMIALVINVLSETRSPGGWLGTALHLLAYNATMVTFILIGVTLHHHFRGAWSTAQTSLITAALGVLFLIQAHIGPVKTIEREVQVSYFISLTIFVAAYLAHRRVPRVAAVNWLANISYPLYLVHPILGYLLLYGLIKVTGHFLVALPVTVALVMLWAWALHVLVEVPSNDLGRRLARRIDGVAEEPPSGAVQDRDQPPP